jgi:hypothetical protein
VIGLVAHEDDDDDNDDDEEEEDEVRVPATALCRRYNRTVCIIRQSRRQPHCQHVLKPARVTASSVS